MPAKKSKTELWSNGTCEGCGKRVVFIAYTNAEGKEVRLPLDPVPGTYKIIRQDGKLKMLGRADTDEKMPVFVSHFATCAKARDFSGRNKS